MFIKNVELETDSKRLAIIRLEIVLKKSWSTLFAETERGQNDPNGNSQNTYTHWYFNTISFLDGCLNRPDTQDFLMGVILKFRMDQHNDSQDDQENSGAGKDSFGHTQRSLPQQAHVRLIPAYGPSGALLWKKDCTTTRGNGLFRPKTVICGRHCGVRT